MMSLRGTLSTSCLQRACSFKQVDNTFIVVFLVISHWNRGGEYWKLLGSGSHSLGIFRGNAKLYYKMAFGFMKAGLEKGELATYVTREDSDRIKGEMKREWGNSFHNWEAKKQIQVISSDSVFPRGFKIKDTLSSLAETHQRTIAAGFTGWRLVDITFYPQEEEHLRRLVECDKEYNNLGIGITTLCMYENPEAYEFEAFVDLLFCHKQIVSQGLKILNVSGRFLGDAINSVFAELFGESGSKSVLSHVAKVVEVPSTAELLKKLEQKPELLRRGLSTTFGESAYAICRLVEERLAELTIGTIM